MGHSGPRLGPDPLRWLTRRGPTAVVVALTITALIAVASAQARLLYGLLRQHGKLLLRVEALEAVGGGAVPAPVSADGLPVGATAPEFALNGVHGETLTLASLRAAGRPVMLVFADAACGPCHALLPELAAAQRDSRTAATIAVVATGARSSMVAAAHEHDLVNVLTEDRPTVAESFRYRGTPAAVLVQPDGTMGAALATGADAIRNLLAPFLGASAPVALLSSAPPAPLQGQPAPPIELRTIDDEEFSLAGFRGQPSVVLFWDPACIFCRQMGPDLRQFEQSAGSALPNIVVVSTGSAEENRSLGFRSPIVLDPSQQTMKSFGVAGTPMAVLVDAEGRVASEAAAGAAAVIALAESASMAARLNPSTRRSVQ